jgi:hypothetical protein
MSTGILRLRPHRVKPEPEPARHILARQLAMY